ncbi:MAG: winged helix DNA-binding domain-containing protein [Pelagimonas sp.]|jgi:uncharacterized protein YcaQ|nr:winged helix DNA-binding domain-containing protein [Pelagimonas sp.]
MVRLDNASARRLFLHAHALAEPPQGPGKGQDLLDLITRLGFVQVDSVRTIERAHHMILFARRPAYRPQALAPLLERDRTLFEQWTHDAAVIPTAFYPYWQLRFDKGREKLRERWEKWRREGFADKFDAVLDQIRDHGPCGSADVGADEARSKGGWWDWHPSKTALEYLWRAGDLAVCHRENFRKVYDLSDRVIPVEHRWRPSEEDSVDWLCRAALDRLGFATQGELAAFWDTISPARAGIWVKQALERGEIIPVEIELHDGSWRKSVAYPDILERIAAAPTPPGRMRVLSPFDPALRDRKRAERLFGFHYRIEIFVPEAKRVYGYYVFPLLEGDRLVGRIDMSADRKAGALVVRALWPERGIRWGQGRQARLEAELTRVLRFAGLEEVVWEPGWLREAK